MQRIGWRRISRATACAPGNRVAVWLPSRVETAIALLACSRNGYVCCPSLHRDHTVEDVVAPDRAHARRGADRSNRLRRRCRPARRLHRTSRPRLPALRVARLARPTLSRLANCQAPALEADASGDANQVMYLPFTSGTTGDAEGRHAQRQHAACHCPDDGARLAPGARRALHAEPVQPQSRARRAGHGAGRRRRTGRCTICRAARSLLDRLEETGAEFLFGVPTHAIDLLAEMRARGAAGCRRGARVSHLGRGNAGADDRRADALRYRAAERLWHDGNLLAPIHAARTIRPSASSRPAGAPVPATRSASGGRTIRTSRRRRAKSAKSAAAAPA